MERVYLLISGDVQGVGFRWYVADSARALELVGWVRNLHTGEVEVIAEGKREHLEQLVTECREGPPYSQVEDVKVEWQSATGELKGFRIAYDA